MKYEPKWKQYWFNLYLSAFIKGISMILLMISVSEDINE